MDSKTIYKYNIGNQWRERTEHIMREGLTNKKTFISGIVTSQVVEDLGSSFTFYDMVFQAFEIN